MRMLCPRHDHGTHRRRCIGPGCRVYESGTSRRPPPGSLGKIVKTSKGIKLRTSDHSYCGYKGVFYARQDKLPFRAMFKRTRLGAFATAVEAARCYSAHMDALEAEAAKKLKVAEAPTKQKLILSMTHKTTTGFKGVSPSPYGANRYDAKYCGSDGNDTYLGSYDTAHEAAAAYAAFVKDQAGFLAARQREADKKLRGLVRRVGDLDLILSAKNSTGYKNVNMDTRRSVSKPYQANGDWPTRKHLGNFETAVDAAVAYARYKRNGGSGARSPQAERRRRLERLLGR